MIESLPAAELAARFGTPLYVYSRAAIEASARAYADAVGDRPVALRYAVKANSSLAILQLLSRLGWGFDVVSGGELARVLAAGANASQVVFSGVGKTDAEIEAALRAGVQCINVESLSELQRLNRVAGSTGVPAPVSLRINPDVDPRTHPYISTGLRNNKFGIAQSQARQAYAQCMQLPHLRVLGIDVHIGSQITEIGPYLDALDRVLDLVHDIERDGVRLHHLDLGGGLGIRYADETPPSPAQWIDALCERLQARGQGHRQVLLEPGRSVVGNAGVLLCEVVTLKSSLEKHFAVVDAAMNDLMRPALYEAWQRIEPAQARDGAQAMHYDVVGPVCESGDWLGRDRQLDLREGDVLAILSAGAYGMAMASNYNTRPRAAEVLVDGGKAQIIRERESLQDLLRGEHPLQD
ncbi:MAG: diaminopimelate decarboxylase [Betaproteobacteria bacterium]|nr:diaminopimelate decarboxylase [Betaproteobacteria bacterium]MBU6513973.1 diaminopimelate decarboxylase [Betaproteobacteria bacterium]MDE1956637.1 diaminopimelate decarboxylase [Betaproteobacteria bacterium]MDE2153922.1 diaminopimelate decarboxylase [Betaproteobacteria bacterium]MDE2479694.1 diaminopimelate decarboxylase [Betaproteobacteria bacterium]